MSGPWRLVCGQRVWFEDEQHLVEGLMDNAVRLRSQTGQVRVILLGVLLGDATFRPADQPVDPRRKAAGRRWTRPRYWTPSTRPSAPGCSTCNATCWS